MKIIRILFFAAIVAAPAGAQTKKLQIAPGLNAAINHEPGSRMVQVLMPGVETIELDLTQSPNNTFLIKTADYNFDGYKDFAFTSKDASNPSAPAIYDIFLYSPQEKSFEALENPGGTCEYLSNVRLNAGDKTLRSSCRTGSKSSLDIFRWAGPNSLELVKSTDNSAEAQQEAAEEKAEKKQEQAESRKEVREEREEQRNDKREQRKQEREDRNEDDD